MSNVYLEKIADAVSPTAPKRTSTEKTFALSEGLGMAASLGGGLIGGRLGSKPLGKLIAAKPMAQAIGRKLFGKDAVITGTHLGSEVGAHVLGAIGSYGAMKGIATFDNSRKNKYLQKAAELVSTH